MKVQMRQLRAIGVIAGTWFVAPHLYGQSSEPVLRPVTRAEQAATSPEGFALLRIRVIDSYAQRGPGTTEAIDKAKERGAVEKATLLSNSLANNTVVAWTPPASVAVERIYSSAMMRGVSESLERVNSSIALLKSAAAQAGLLKGVLPGGRLTISPLGFTRTNPTIKPVEPLAAFNLLRADSSYARNIVSRAVAQGTLVPSSATEEGSVRVVVPEAPLTSTAPVSTVEIKVPCSDLALVRKQYPERAVETVFDGCPDAAYLPISVQADSDAGANEQDAAQLDDATVAELRVALARDYPPLENARIPLLVIFDDGFPTEAAYSATMAFFQDADRTLWRAYGLDPQWLAKPLIKDGFFNVAGEFESAPPTLAGPPRGLAGCPTLDASTCRLHARKIHDALIPLQGTVKNGASQPVRVIYVPFFFAQDGALRTAHSISRFRLLTHSDYENKSAFTTYEQKGIKFYQDEILTPLLKGVGQTYPPPASVWKVPASYFAAVVHYFRMYSDASDVPVFMNFSWRIPAKNDGQMPNRGTSKMAIVAAAGNPCQPGVTCKTFTVDEPELGDYQFLQYAQNDFNYYIVANIDRSGNAACGSARLRLRENTLAFPGGIADDCGTSFSAPRVAWIMAAKDRYRTKSTGAALRGDAWFKLFKPLTEDRSPDLCDFPHNMNCLRLDLHKTFPGHIRESVKASATTPVQ